MNVGKFEYNRVTKEHHCPICDGEQWCLISVNNDFVVCPRVSEGSIKRYSFGYLHKLSDDTVAKLPKRPPPKPKKPFNYFNEIKNATSRVDEDLKPLADVLGLSIESLKLMDVTYHNKNEPAWGFPMRGADGEICGIKYRNLQGAKWCASGSKLGVYVPLNFKAGLCPIYVAEGESDTAALVMLGYNAIGRPSATTGMAALMRYLRPSPEVYIFADTDENNIGLDSSTELRDMLMANAKVVYNPRYKDVRDWCANDTLTDWAIESHIYHG